jgi:hypothetical protein
MKKTPWVLIFSLAVACTAENTNRSGLKPREADWSSINGGSSADSSNSVKDLNVLARTTGNQGEASADDSKISGPYKYKNIEIFLMHGKDRVKAGKILTLQEALKQKKVKIHETGDVQKLAIENLTGDEEIFIQAGDIVRGGKQDRVLTFDLMISPNSGRVPLAAFCVERSRWNQRGGESAVQFSASTNCLPSKSLKIATRRARSQGEVWKSVAKSQNVLGTKLNASVEAKASPTSLLLTLDNKELQKSAGPYKKALLDIIKGKKDVIGFAYALNGKINNVDLYACHALFVKLWPKLLQAAVTEALMEKGEAGLVAKPVTSKMVAGFLLALEKGAAEKQKVNPRMKAVTRESARGYLFETSDQKRKGKWLRRNYLAK